VTSNDSCAGIYVRCDPPDRRTHRVLTAGAHARALKPSFSNLARPNRGYIATRVRRAPRRRSGRLATTIENNLYVRIKGFK